MVEQWTHKPLDVGSNPTLATIFLSSCSFLIDNSKDFDNKKCNYKKGDSL